MQKARIGIALATIAGACFVGSPASAGVECRGTGTYNHVFPGQTCTDQAIVKTQIVVSNSSASWSSWTSSDLTYNNNVGGTWLYLANTAVEFSDRFTSLGQNFDNTYTDGWQINQLTQDGFLQVTDLHWGGTWTAQLSCTNTNGQMVGKVNTDGIVVVSFGTPMCGGIH